ncbi:MAG: hypothetical protein AUG51_06605 [Acidobacteria bacterium 13_1_20CM_3_53_8]|nr:MAG: hypothetical protein AUG51_06605 [Acidobacteria bacterium 13_1_20CM_3_53_8]
MKLRLFLFALFLNLLFALPLAAQSFDEVFVNGDRLTYQGYEVTRHYNARTRDSIAIIKKNSRLLAELNYGQHFPDSTKFGLFSLLGDGRKQLIIEQNTGGGNCCNLYWVYDLSPTFRMLYSGMRYDAYNGVSPEDIDGDGVYELVAIVESFINFDQMSHTSSPMPEVVFKYDLRAGRYKPASRTFASYLLKGIESDIHKAQDANARLTTTSSENYHGSYLGAILTVVLKYIYAGREVEGWAFYDREYRLDDRVAMKAKIKKQLRESVLYNSLHMRGNHRG